MTFAGQKFSKSVLVILLSYFIRYIPLADRSKFTTYLCLKKSSPSFLIQKKSLSPLFQTKIAPCIFIENNTLSSSSYFLPKSALWKLLYLSFQDKRIHNLSQVQCYFVLTKRWKMEVIGFRIQWQNTSTLMMKYTPYFL